MMYRTHAAFSGMIALLWVKLFPLASMDKNILFVFLVIAFGTIPDLDHEKSWISQKFHRTSQILRLIFSHRGFMHSIFPAFIMYFGFRYLGLPTIALGLSIGYLSHILGDAITTEGINFLTPLLHLKIEGFIHTGTVMETVILVILLLVDGLLVYGILSNFILGLGWF